MNSTTNITAKLTSPTTTTTTTTTTTNTTKKLDWCNLIDHSIVKLERLSSAKNIVVLNEKDDQLPSWIHSIDDAVVYDDAKAICESICGNLYFPASQKENDEVEDAFNSITVDAITSRPFWIRLSYNETEKRWKDADNKGRGLFFILVHARRSII